MLKNLKCRFRQIERNSKENILERIATKSSERENVIKVQEGLEITWLEAELW